MKRWLRNKLHSFLYAQDEAVTSVAIHKYSNSISHGDSIPEIQFTVAPARGGLIVNVRTYDKQRESHLYVNHIINDDEDVAKKVADIVSVELMKI